MGEDGAAWSQRKRRLLWQPRDAVDITSQQGPGGLKRSKRQLLDEPNSEIYTGGTGHAILDCVSIPQTDRRLNVS